MRVGGMQAMALLAAVLLSGCDLATAEDPPPLVASAASNPVTWRPITNGALAARSRARSNAEKAARAHTWLQQWLRQAYAEWLRQAYLAWAQRERPRLCDAPVILISALTWNQWAALCTGARPDYRLLVGNFPPEDRLKWPYGNITPP
jgi:hypothetical protein